MDSKSSRAKECIFVVLQKEEKVLFNPFMPNGFFYLNSLNRFISYIKVVWLVFIVTIFVEISKLQAKCLDPNQTPPSVAFDLGLNCLPMTFMGCLA